jgi:hypothetical protein
MVPITATTNGSSALDYPSSLSHYQHLLFVNVLNRELDNTPFKIIVKIETNQPTTRVKTTNIFLTTRSHLKMGWVYE